MTFKERLQYIWDYYKIPILSATIVVLIAVSILHSILSRRDASLYLAPINIVSDAYSDGQLKDDFPGGKTVEIYSGLYLTADPASEFHQYSYASRIKLLGAINDEKLDIVLMNQEAFDSFSANGYLLDLSEFLAKYPAEDLSFIQPYLIDNTVILEDNHTDVLLDDSIPYQAKMRSAPFGLSLSPTAFYQNAGFSDPLYLGVIANSPRLDVVIAYMEWLYGI